MQEPHIRSGTSHFQWSFFFKKNFMAPFYGWGSNVSRLEPLRWGSLLFTTKFPEIPGTHFNDLERTNGWVDLGATQWFWTWDPWIKNPAPWPLGHRSLNKYKCLLSMPLIMYILFVVKVRKTCYRKKWKTESLKPIHWKRRCQLQCLVSTKMSHILNQTSSWKLQVC